jgi:hypothetical protein
MRMFMDMGKIRRINLFLIFQLILLSVFISGVTDVECSEKADNIDILVIGSGRIIDGNIAAARKDAISDALLKGVEEYLTRYLGSQIMINNFPRLINEVIPGSKDEIENFNILAEERGDKLYKILVRMKVNEGLMEEKLNQNGIIFRDVPPVKFLFLVSQRDSQDKDVIYWWNDPDRNSPLTSTELVLHRVFQECGFNPVNRLSSSPEDRYSNDMRKPDLTDGDAIEWGRLYASDVVIVGKSEIIENKMVSLSLKSIDVKKKIIINEDFQKEQINQYGNDREQVMDTLARAVNSIVTRLSPAIISSFEKMDEVSLIDVELRGLRSLDQLIDFSDFLKKDIDGVKSVVEKRIKADSIDLTVEFSGDEDTFFNRVKGHEGFPFITGLNKKEGGGLIIELK